LIQMNAALAAAAMYKRRFEAIPADIQNVVDAAQAKLAALEAGTEVFTFEETQAAGVLQEYDETAQDVANRNLPSYVARRCLGRRDNVRPYPNSGYSG
jgi:DNA repair ATPase RecN